MFKSILGTDTYFLFIIIAALATTLYIYWQAKRQKFSLVVVLDMALFGTLGGVLGARLFHVFFESAFLPNPDYYWEKPIRILHFWQGGYVGYGAFIGTTLAILAYLFIRKLPVLKYADLVALGAPLIVFFIRIGCLGEGCCYGKPTDFWLHFTFTDEIPRHATQLYDMINALLAFGIVHWVYFKKRHFLGLATLSFFASYAVGRFWIEFLRGDADRGVYLNFISTSQITSLVILGVVIVLFFVLSRKGQKS